MKIALIILGSLVLVVVVYFARLFTRLGKPVNSTLSDSYYYHARKKLIVYSPMGNWFELGYTEMNADAETFTVISRDFGKDKQAIYRKGEAQQVDYASFVIDEHGIPKDAFHVYYDHPYSGELTTINEADPKTYQPYTVQNETYNQRWGRDHQAVFLYGKKVDVDGKTFTRINQALAFDSLSLYAIVTDYNAQSGSVEDNTRVLRTGDTPDGQAEAINDSYARFNTTIIHSSWKTEFTSITFPAITTINVVDERNIFVNETLVSDGRQLEGIDVVSLEIIGRDYLKDKTSVYFDTQKIVGADPNTFMPIYENYSKDKHHVYFKTQILPNADPDKIKIDYASRTISDGKLTFKEGELVK